MTPIPKLLRRALAHLIKSQKDEGTFQKQRWVIAWRNKVEMLSDKLAVQQQIKGTKQP